MPALYTHTTRANGTVLTAAIYNSDHQNHIDNGIPASLDDYSISTTQMQSQTDPGEVGSESLAVSLAGELERLRFSLAELKKHLNGGTQPFWYQTVSGAVSGTTGTFSAGLSATTGTFSSNVTVGGTLGVTGVATFHAGPVFKAIGSEGGQITLEKAPASTLGGNVEVDTLGELLRIFESGGSTRGATFNIAAASATVGTQLVGHDMVQTLTNKTLTTPTINSPTINTALFSDGNTGRLQVVSNTQTSFGSAALESASSSGDVYISLHAQGATAAVLKHTRGGSGVSILDAANALANFACAATSASTVSTSGSVIAGTNLLFGAGGTFQAGTIYSDSNYGVIFRAKTASPAIAHMEFRDGNDVTLFRVDNANNFSIARNALLLQPIGTSGFAIEVGNQNGTAVDSLIDFHTGATVVDYDTRIVASGGTGAAGGGNLGFIGATVQRGLVAGSVSTARMLIDVQVFTASGTWTKPNGVTAAEVWVVGGGGGSGGTGATTAGQSAIGGNGGGAGLAYKFITAGLGAAETVTVGAGGAAGASTPAAGDAGGTSSFGAHCSATGGGGGAAGTGAAPPIETTGGSIGTGSGGTINLTGTSGGVSASFVFGQFHQARPGFTPTIGTSLTQANTQFATAPVSPNPLCHGAGALGARRPASAAALAGAAGADGIVIVKSYG